MSRSAPAKTRALEVVLHPHPLKGLRRAPRHNARIIMRNPLHAALRAALERGLFGSRPHNVRSCQSARAASADARCKARRSAANIFPRPPAAQCSFARNRCALPATPLAPAAPKGSHLVASLSCAVAALRWIAARALRARERAAPAPSAEDGARHGRCNPERPRGEGKLGSPCSPVDEGRGSASPSSTGERR